MRELGQCTVGRPVLRCFRLPSRLQSFSSLHNSWYECLDALVAPQGGC